MIESTVWLSPEELQLWLEWAGAKLYALPVRGTRPDSWRTFWPDVVPDWQPNMIRERRAPVPTAAEIPIMDLILLLPNLCDETRTRFILHARSRVHPLSGRYFMSWTKLATTLHSERRIVKRWWESGIQELTVKVPHETRSRISAFFDAAPPPA